MTRSTGLATPPPAPYRFTVDDYHRMAAAGILTEDDRVELIEGEILAMPPIGEGHAGGVNRLSWLFTDRVGRRAVVAVQNPVRLSRHSEPQPDLAILRPRADFYAGKMPEPDDVLLLIEVSDTTLAYDRDVKVPLYAAAGIAEVWLVDLAGDRLRRYREPDAAAGEYRHVEVLARGATVAPRAFPDVTFNVDEILG
jgi:Uma2 family endonuclease